MSEVTVVYYDEAATWDTGAMEKIMEGKKINERAKSPIEQWADEWAGKLEE